MGVRIMSDENKIKYTGLPIIVHDKPDWCECQPPEFPIAGEEKDEPLNTCQKCHKQIQISKIFNVDLNALQIKVLKPKPFEGKIYHHRFPYYLHKLLIFFHLRKNIEILFIHKSDGVFMTKNDLITTNFKAHAKLRDLK